MAKIASVVVGHFGLCEDFTISLLVMSCTHPTAEPASVETQACDANNRNTHRVIFVIFLLLCIQGRNLIQFGTMIQCATPRSFWDYMDYGCYCGYGGRGTPVDALDRQVEPYPFIFVILFYYYAEIQAIMDPKLNVKIVTFPVPCALTLLREKVMIFLHNYLIWFTGFD